MDFHGLTRRELQALCKRNKIPANQTNVAMADALHALSNVEGIEELSQPEGFQTPAPCRMNQRTARKKSELTTDALVIEPEDSAAPVSRASRRGTAARASASRRVISEEEGKTTEVAALEALQSPLPTRFSPTRRATVGKSTRRASEAQHDVAKLVGTKSNLKMSVRRSARLKSVDQSVEVLPSAATISRRKKMAVKIEAPDEEMEASTENMAALLANPVETADFTNVEEGALESEDKAGLFLASNDLTVEATEEMTLSGENKSEVVDEKELTGDFKSEPLLPAEVTSPTKESKLDVVDATNTALLEKETESVDISARRSARIKSANKAVDVCLSVTESRNKKINGKIGSLTAEQEDFTDNMPRNMSARKSARIKSVNKAAKECPSVTKSRSTTMAAKIGALTAEQEDFTDNMPGEMVDTVHTANYTNVEVPFVSIDKTGLNDVQNVGGEDELNAEAAEEVALREESKSEVAEEEETGCFKREPLPGSEVMPSSEEIKNDVDNTNIALLEAETKTVIQKSFLGDMDEDSYTQLPNASSNVLEDGEKVGIKDFMGRIGNFSIDDSAASKKTVSFLNEMEEPTGQEELKCLNPTLTDTKIEEYEQIAGPAADVSIKDKNLFVGEVPVEAVSEEIKNDVDNTNIALLEAETKTVVQESFLGDMDEDSYTQLPNASSNVLEDGEKAGIKDFMGSVGNFSIDDSAASKKTVSFLNEMEPTGQEELKSLNPTLTDTTKIEEYEQIAGPAADVSIKDKNLFVGEVPVEAVGEEFAVNINSNEWSFFMGGCGDSAILSPDATSSVLTAKEHDLLASNRVSESPFLLNILYEEPSEKESERIFIEGTEKTPMKENLNTNSVSKTPILFDTEETEAMLVVGTEKKTPRKESVKKNLSAKSVSTTSNLFNVVAEEMMHVGTEKKTPEKTSATPGESNGKKKTRQDADKENNGGAQSLKRENVKKSLQLVNEKSSMYQDLSLRQLKVLYKEKAYGVKKAPVLQPLNQNCLLGDGNI